MRIALAIAAILLTAGCAANRTAFYDAQNDYREQVSARDAAKAAALQTAAAGCADDSCRIAIAGFAALARGEALAAPAQYRSEGAAVLNLVDRAIGIGGSAYGARMSRDTLIGVAGIVANSAGDRSTHSFIDQSDHSDHSTSIADSFNSEAGDTISDSGNVSDSNNGNAGRDLIGRDVIDNSGNYGDDNRLGSDGPIDNSDDGNDCSGESCNPVEEPNEPAPLTAPKSTDPVGDAIHELRMDLIDIRHRSDMNKLNSDQVDWMEDAIRRSNQAAEGATEAG